MKITRLKALLGIEDTSKDDILEFVVENVEETIKNYCNLDKVPIELNSIVIRMAIDLYRNENLGNEESSLGSISSISEGDTTVSYRSSASEFKDSLLKNYEKQLKRYRKLVW